MGTPKRRSSAGGAPDTGPEPKRPNPLARRRLLRAVAGAVAATAGAAAFLSRTKQALASATTISSSDTTATLESDNISYGTGL
jgi:hypothetical protein